MIAYVTTVVELSGQRWLLYHLTVPQGARRIQLDEIHREWRATLERRLRLAPDSLVELRVVEPHSDGTPHLHGLIAIPRRLPGGFAQLSLEHGLIWVMTRLWLYHAQVPRSGQRFAARIEPLRDPGQGIRYCLKSVKHERADVDLFGDWPRFDHHVSDRVSLPYRRPTRAGGRPLSALPRALEKIDWLHTQGITASPIIERHVRAWIKANLFSRGTWKRAKRVRGFTSRGWHWVLVSAQSDKTGMDAYGHQWVLHSVARAGADGADACHA
jgi:hypothetical protein